MDLTQQKLTKSEWDFLEVPVNIKEKKILKLIYNGYENTGYTSNEANSLLSWMKIGTKEEEFHYYIYENNFNKIIKKIITKYELSFIIKKNKKSNKKLKKQDLIRIKNSSKKIEDIKENIYEFILLNNAKMFFKKKLCSKRYYTLTQLIKNNVTYINHYVLQFVHWIIETYKNKISKGDLIKNAYEYIEKNTEVFKYTDMKLYEHQAKLFDSVKREGSKMILYQAPTGTGKTMSPV